MNTHWCLSFVDGGQLSGMVIVALPHTTEDQCSRQKSLDQAVRRAEWLGCRPVGRAVGFSFNASSEFGQSLLSRFPQHQVLKRRLPRARHSRLSPAVIAPEPHGG